jgi:hypothetical protein
VEGGRFRPHLAWDLDTGCLIVAEFRKSSARGTSTVKGFTKDYLLPEFQDLFECVYLDSEYTGKDVWEFILDPDSNAYRKTRLSPALPATPSLDGAPASNHPPTAAIESREPA